MVLTVLRIARRRHDTLVVRHTYIIVTRLQDEPLVWNVSYQGMRYVKSMRNAVCCFKYWLIIYCFVYLLAHPSDWTAPVNTPNTNIKTPPTASPTPSPATTTTTTTSPVVRTTAKPPPTGKHHSISNVVHQQYYMLTLTRHSWIHYTDCWIVKYVD